MVIDGLLHDPTETILALPLGPVLCNARSRSSGNKDMNQTWAHDYSIKQSLQNSMRFRLVFVLESEDR